MFFKLYAIALLSFLVIDALWLGLIAKQFYKNQIGALMKTDINWTAAVLFYLIFISGLVVFVISPAIEQQSYTKAITYGALFGLVTYATYDLTNLATLNNFPLTVTIVDLFWGMFISISVSVITIYIYNSFIGSTN